MYDMNVEKTTTTKISGKKEAHLCFLLMNSDLIYFMINKAANAEKPIAVVDG